MEAGSNLCQGAIAPSRANHSHPKGQHWRSIPCCSQMLCARCLLTCSAGMSCSKGAGHTRISCSALQVQMRTAKPQQKKMWLVTCRIAGDWSTSQDATGYCHSSHIQKIDKVGKAAKIGILGPCHAGCQLLLCLDFCTKLLLAMPSFFEISLASHIKATAPCPFSFHKLALREILPLCNGLTEHKDLVVRPLSSRGTNSSDS